ncbi:hypothetical protein BJX99DRAFT_262480 [Aspergillus californicus]
MAEHPIKVRIRSKAHSTEEMNTFLELSFDRLLKAEYNIQVALPGKSRVEITNKPAAITLTAPKGPNRPKTPQELCATSESQSASTSRLSLREAFATGEDTPLKEDNRCTTHESMCMDCKSTKSKVHPRVDQSKLEFLPPHHSVVVNLKFYGSLDRLCDVINDDTVRWKNQKPGSVSFKTLHAVVRTAASKEHPAGEWYDMDFIKDMRDNTSDHPYDSLRLRDRIFNRRYVKDLRDSKIEEILWWKGVCAREVSLLIDTYGPLDPDVHEWRNYAKLSLMIPCDIRIRWAQWATDHYCLRRLEWWKETHPIDPEALASSQGAFLEPHPEAKLFDTAPSPYPGQKNAKFYKLSSSFPVPRYELSA